MYPTLGADIAGLTRETRRMLRQRQRHIDLCRRLGCGTAEINIHIRRRPGEAELLVVDQDFAVDQADPQQAPHLALIVRLRDELLEKRAEIGAVAAAAW